MMTVKIKQNELSDWQKKAIEAMLLLVRTKASGFCADDFNALCAGTAIPRDIIKRLSGKLFREFQAANQIKKTCQYVLSARNSSPLPIWVAVSQQQ